MTSARFRRVSSVATSRRKAAAYSPRGRAQARRARRRHFCAGGMHTHKPAHDFHRRACTPRGSYAGADVGRGQARRHARADPAAPSARSRSHASAAKTCAASVTYGHTPRGAAKSGARPACRARAAIRRPAYIREDQAALAAATQTGLLDTGVSASKMPRAQGSVPDASSAQVLRL